MKGQRCCVFLSSRSESEKQTRLRSSRDNGVAETMAGVVESEVEVMSVMAGEIRQL